MREIKTKRFSGILIGLLVCLPVFVEAGPGTAERARDRNRVDRAIRRDVTLRLSPAHCRNRVQDSGESAVDCGGECGRCGAGIACQSDSDCSTGICGTYCPTAAGDPPGPCRQACVACRDTDPSDNPLEGGRLDRGATSRYDRCVSANQVEEAGCNLKGEEIVSGKPCPSGFTCQEEDGPDRCVQLPPARDCFTCAGSACISVGVYQQSCDPLFDNDRCDSSCGSETPPEETHPDERDRELCEAPDPSALEEGTQYWDFPGGRHISRCENEGRVRYIICGAEGELTTSVSDCSEGNDCQNGFCQLAPTCTDSDGGDNPDQRGTITGHYRNGRDFSRSDECFEFFGAYWLIEYGCHEDGSSGYNEGPCPDGKRCEWGRCVTPPPPIVTTCNDTDGENSHEAGQISGQDDYGRPYTKPDRCVGDSHVLEYLCTEDNRHYNSREISCDQGQGERCSEGRCRYFPPADPTCTDTDGEDIHQGGNVSGQDRDQYSFFESDRCLDSVWLIEQICRPDGNRSYLEIPCPPGETCREGVCIVTAVGEPGVSCTDSDQGEDIHRPGTVSGQDQSGTPFSRTDSCEGTVSHTGSRGGTAGVHEYSCNPDRSVANRYIPCPQNEWCELNAGWCTVRPPAQPTCTDTDGGENLHQPGSVGGQRADWSTFREKDRCADNSYIVEQFCRADGTPGQVEKRCPEGEFCKSIYSDTLGWGAKCEPYVEPVCNDSDGEDIHQKGVVSGRYSDGRDFRNEDHCSGRSNVSEYVCPNNNVGEWEFRTIPCPRDETCEDGRCTGRCDCHVVEPASPGGARSVVDKNCVEHHDFCDGTVLKRLGCNADGLHTIAESVACPGGCANGVCQ